MKEFVKVSAACGTTVDQFKSIQIELTFKTGEPRLPKVQWYDVLKEALWMANHKRPAARDPGYDIGLSHGFRFRQEAVELFRKGFNDAASHAAGAIAVKERMR